MAPLFLRLLVAAAAALLGVLAVAVSVAGEAGYARVFSFGDSLTDTGNALHLPCTGGGGPASRPPYGETFFRRPTGRASDGRLALDFLVEALRLPHPAPYIAAVAGGGKTAGEFRHGVNFAVGGSTALSPEFYEGRGLKPFVPVSLANQTVWFQQVVRLLGSSSVHGSKKHFIKVDRDVPTAGRNVQCIIAVLSVTCRKKFMASSLFIVGEIGVNDYFVSLVGNLTVGEVSTFVPNIVAAIRFVVNEVIVAGATTVVVPGMIPLGCEPQLLALYDNDAAAAGGDYDPKSGCMTRLNALAELHNRELSRAIGELRREHPAASVVYADLYGAVTDIVVSPGRHGFRDDTPLAACCGAAGAGAYNFNVTAFCGAAGTTACADPSAYVSWDGVHFTEAANRQIACAVLNGGGAAPTTWLAASMAGRSKIGCT
uniref:Esterase n=1 Tax=Leersia perrieri TaxID=77586 RepID=A0A0D9XJB5_9ORYZ